MKNLFVWALIFMPLWVFGQTPCAYYSKYIDKGNAEIRKGSQANFELAIDAYSTAMIHCPDKAEEARGKILEVFKAIERLKKEAENANRVAKDQTQVAESAKIRAEKLLRATRNLALAAEKNEYDPTMSLNIMRYNLMRHPEDESSKSNYLRLAKYAQKMSCKKILPKSSDAYGKVLSLDIAEDDQSYVVKYQNETMYYDLRSSQSIPLYHSKDNGPILLSANGMQCLYGESRDQLVFYNVKNQKAWSLSSIASFAYPNPNFVSWRNDEPLFITDTISDKIKGKGGNTGYLFPEVISAYALSQDGRFCVIGTEEGSLYIWKPEERTLKQYPGRHNAPITSISISADGWYILTGSEDWIARLWSNKSERTVQAFLGHTDAISAVALSPDGKSCLTAGEDFSFRLWDAYSGKEKNVFTGTHEKVITQLSFTPDGSKFLTGNAWEPARIWELKSGRPLGVFSEIRVPFAASKRHILTSSSDNRCRIWEFNENLAYQSLSANADMSNVACLLRGDDPNHIFIGSEYQNLGLWNLQQNNLTWFNTDVNSPVLSLGLDKKTGNILAAYEDNVIRAILLKYEAKGPFYDTIRNIFNKPPEIRTFYQDSIRDAVVYTIRLPSHPGTLTKGVFSKEARDFAGIYENGELLVWGLKDQAATERLHLHLKQNEFSLGNSKQYSSVVPTILNTHFDLSSEEGILALGGPDSIARLWDLRNQRIKHTLKGHQGPITQIKLSDDGALCMTGSRDQDIKIWDTESGQLLSTLVGHAGDITALAFSPDGTRCMSGSEDLTTRIWDTSSGELLYSYTGYLSPAAFVSISTDGAYCISATREGAILQWRVGEDCAECRAYRLTLEELWREGVTLEPEDLRAIQRER